MHILLAGESRLSLLAKNTLNPPVSHSIWQLYLHYIYMYISPKPDANRVLLYCMINHNLSGSTAQLFAD